MTCVKEVPKHHLGHIDVGDDPVLQGTYGLDTLGGPPEHSLGFEPDAEDSAGSLLHGYDGGLVEDDPLALHVDQCIGRSQINGDVIDRNQTSGREPTCQQCSRFEAARVRRSLRICLRARNIWRIKAVDLTAYPYRLQERCYPKSYSIKRFRYFQTLRCRGRYPKGSRIPVFPAFRSERTPVELLVFPARSARPPVPDSAAAP